MQSKFGGLCESTQTENNSLYNCRFFFLFSVWFIILTVTGIASVHLYLLDFFFYLYLRSTGITISPREPPQGLIKFYSILCVKKWMFPLSVPFTLCSMMESLIATSHATPPSLDQKVGFLPDVQIQMMNTDS